MCKQCAKEYLVLGAPESTKETLGMKCQGLKIRTSTHRKTMISDYTQFVLVNLVDYLFSIHHSLTVAAPQAPSRLTQQRLLSQSTRATREHLFGGNQKRERKLKHSSPFPSVWFGTSIIPLSPFLVLGAPRSTMEVLGLKCQGLKIKTSTHIFIKAILWLHTVRVC